MYFGNYGLRKQWLDKCLKSPVSGHPLKSNMVKGSKLCLNLNHTTLSIFIDQCADNRNGKNLS